MSFNSDSDPFNSLESKSSRPDPEARMAYPPLEPFANDLDQAASGGACVIGRVGANPAAWPSWILILLVLGVTLAIPFVVPQNQMYSVEDPAIPAILHLQGKALYGASQIDPNEPVPFKELEVFTATVGAAWAVAAIQSATSEDLVVNRESIRVLLERFDSQLTDADTIQVHEAVKRTTLTPTLATAADWQLVEDRLGWFGEVLSAEKNPATTYSADDLGSDAVVKAVVLGGVMLAGIGLGMLGVVLLIAGVVLVFSGRMKMRPVLSLHGHANLYLQAFAVFLTVNLVVHLVVSAFGVTSLVIAAAAVVGAVGVGYLWPLLRGVPYCPAWTDLGINRGEGLVKEIFAGVIGYIAILPFFGLGILMMFILMLILGVIQMMQGGTPEPQPALSHPAIEVIANGGLWARIAILFLASVMAPLIEEFIFRGTFFVALRQRFGFIISAGITAFVFAAIHPQGIIAIPALMSLAIGFALLREWRGTLIAPMVAHSLHNGILITVVCVVLS